MSMCGSFDLMCVGIKLYVCFVFEAVPHFSHTDKDISKQRLCPDCVHLYMQIMSARIREIHIVY